MYQFIKYYKKSQLRVDRIAFCVSFLILTVLSSLYILHIWTSSIEETSMKALKSAKIAAATIDEEQIKKIGDGTDDLWKSSYKSLKNKLMEIVSIEKGSRFAYLYREENGNLYLLADSEPIDSRDYSPLGQIYLHAGRTDWEPFISEKPLVTDPVKDYWGTWVKVLIPIRDPGTEEVFAVFGIDYPASTWSINARNDTIQAGMVVVSVYLLWLVFYLLFQRNMMLKRSNKAIKKSEEKFCKAFHSNAALMAISTVAEGIYIDVNKTLLETLGYKREEVVGKKVGELNIFIDKEQQQKIKEDFFQGSELRNIEIRAKGKDQVLHHCLFSLDRIDLDEVPCWIIMMVDITERKKAEEKIFFLSFHDQLTGLYNRRFYEDKLACFDIKSNLPISVIIGDVNGLKFINDSFGHVMGDELLKKVAQVMVKGCRSDDIVARIGGDEFIVLLPKADEEVAQRVIGRMNDLSAQEKVGSISISISFGAQTKYFENERLEELLKKAEDVMYQNKLSQSATLKGTTISPIVSMFYEKNLREGLHSYRVSKLCERMGFALGLSEFDIVKLKMVALLHDIGKVAIDEKILNKPGKLTGSEWVQIKKHAEIGYRIIRSANDLSDMASCVLAHHERWDGKGYPKGLQKEQIPLEARIIAIVDAFDAMTSERSYRGALTEDIAIEELEKNAGTQFDSSLLDIFIKRVLGRSTS